MYVYMYVRMLIKRYDSVSIKENLIYHGCILYILCPLERFFGNYVLIIPITNGPPTLRSR